MLANAGIAELRPVEELTDEPWDDMIDINLTGVWNTVQGRAAAPDRARRGGSIVLTSSTAGLKGMREHWPTTRRPSTASSG